MLAPECPLPVSGDDKNAKIRRLAWTVQSVAHRDAIHFARKATLMATLLLLVLVLLLIGAVPAWPYNTGWGYYPSGGIGLVLAIVLLLALFGAIPWRF